MNWDAIGALGEVVGALAVIVTLLYLAAQTRQTGAAMREVMSRELTGQYDRLAESIIRDPKEAKMYEVATGDPMQVLDNPAGLDDDDLRIFALFMYRWFNSFHNQHQAWRAGTLSQADRDKVVPVIRTFTATPASQDYWRWARDWFDPEFVEFVDGLIAETHRSEEWRRITD